jgi:hypothetical protein
MCVGGRESYGCGDPRAGAGAWEWGRARELSRIESVFWLVHAVSSPFPTSPPYPRAHAIAPALEHARAVGEAATPEPARLSFARTDARTHVRLCCA